MGRASSRVSRARRRGETKMWGRWGAEMGRVGREAVIWVRPKGVRGRAGVEVWRPVADQVVWPWRRRIRRGVCGDIVRFEERGGGWEKKGERREELWWGGSGKFKWGEI